MLASLEPLPEEQQGACGEAGVTNVDPMVAELERQNQELFKELEHTKMLLQQASQGSSGLFISPTRHSAGDEVAPMMSKPS